MSVSAKDDSLRRAWHLIVGVVMDTRGDWRRDVAAVASDTWGLEVLPYETSDVIAPLHQIILVHCGISIGEMFDLEDLAADCAAHGEYDCMLVAPPLPITRAINSPVNPCAIR